MNLSKNIVHLPQGYIFMMGREVIALLGHGRSGKHSKEVGQKPRWPMKGYALGDCSCPLRGRSLVDGVVISCFANHGFSWLVLIVTQYCDCSNVLSGMKVAASEEGQRKIFLVAKKKKASVHLLSIGHTRKSLMVWYWLVQKHGAAKSITTCVAFLETRLHWFVHSSHLLPGERDAVVHPAADPAFGSWLRRYLLRAAVKEFFKKESGSSGPLKYSFLSVF